MRAPEKSSSKDYSTKSAYHKKRLQESLELGNAKKVRYHADQLKKAKDDERMKFICKLNQAETK